MDTDTLEKRLQAIEGKLNQVLDLLQKGQHLTASGSSDSETASDLEIALIMASDDPLAALKERERKIKAREKERDKR